MFNDFDAFVYLLNKYIGSRNMSFPDYLNKIINSQLKNKEIQSVRAQITRLISTNKQKKDNNLSQTQEKALKIQEMPKTISNFFNVHSLHHKKQPPIDARKTFSEMHISRLKKRLTLQQQNRNEIEVHVPQDANMNEWRLEMLKHLRPVVKKTFFQPIPEKVAKQNNHSEPNNVSPQAKPKLKMIKPVKTASSPLLRRRQRRQKVKQQPIQDHLHVSSQRNIILIRPQPISQEEIQERGAIKLKKPPIKQKRDSKKNELQQDQIMIQRMANFTALLPYLGTQKAKVQTRQQKKPKPLPQQPMNPAHMDYPYQLKKKKIVPEQVIQISGWYVPHD